MAGGRVAAGGGLIAIGLVGAYGSITGRITSMIAALGYPNLLKDTTGAAAIVGAAMPPSKFDVISGNATKAQAVAAFNPAPPSAYRSPSSLRAWIAKKYPKASQSLDRLLYDAYAVWAPFKAPKS